ncbi:MAG: TerC family protein [Candidatus Sumerlaeaceae bacterium]|nr:TerC family protein [Candidatus Sumerlaeaceae bacterium]
MHYGLTEWIVFNVFVLAMLALDLGVFHRKPHAVRFKEAMGWSAAWIALALLFNLMILYTHGKQDAQEFLAGYLIEKSLSVDNIFVFIMVFSYFKVDPKYQHRVLFWGILSALILRGIMIGAGAALINRFEWVLYIFGVFLIFTGIKMAVHKDSTLDPGELWIVRAFRRLMPVTDGYREKSFFVRENGRILATPLFLVLLVMETTDVMFALDSIPAIFAVTKNAFIVYTSNVFAILGLRSLYFLLAGVMQLFRYLKFGLAAVLVFVGVKMLLGHTAYAIPIGASLATIAGILVTSIGASIIVGLREKRLIMPPDDPSESP